MHNSTNFRNNTRQGMVICDRVLSTFNRPGKDE